ncbi:uncharacterized protein GGS25DRAFT_494091 [Hypoxylon fragiforme]|uniref:uncharacterized protein n=1 Tax=Hypoxylon fragiforme TaxID=63214 RepID=UPI0020C6F422|nr:uncharacterized protein GGS25DRAFT_494091 [Hypoxylon fragiforme]KAI2607016.1 hypothetical protein GGS25DRAFT_494091 [Hypoxylon fragiforme]
MSSINTSGQTEPPHLPGSFPTDDMTSTNQASGLSSTGSQSHPNKLHKREDPRGWSEEARGLGTHQHTDSGVGLQDQTPSQTRGPTATRGPYDSERVSAPSQATAPGTTSATTGRSTDHYGGESKPGVMTGAYSRLDNNNAENNQKYSVPATQDSRANTSINQHDSATGIGAVGSGSNAGAAGLSNTVREPSADSGHNVVRNGLRQTSELEHTDPYWGEVPHGTGVYNGVTGHGSAETPVAGSLHPQGSELNQGQQRMFPLSTASNPASHATSNTVSNTTAPHTTSNATHEDTLPHSESRFKEVLPEAGVGAGGALAASEAAGKRHDHQHEKDLKDPAPHKYDEADTKKESFIGSLFHRDHKDKHEKDTTKHEKTTKERVPSKDDTPLNERDAGSALAAATVAYGAHERRDKHGSKHHTSTSGAQDDKAGALYSRPNEHVETRARDGQPQTHQSGIPVVAIGHSGPSSQNTGRGVNDTSLTHGDATSRQNPSATHTTDNHHSNLGYGAAGAGAGAGAAYAAHKYASREDNNNTSYPTSGDATRSAGQGHTTGEPGFGAASGTTRSNAVPSSHGHSIPIATSTTAHSRADPNRQGEHNVLNDGTPSGINTNDQYASSHTTSSSPYTTHGTTTRDSPAGAKAGALGASTGAATSRVTGKRHSVSSSQQGAIPESSTSTSRESAGLPLKRIPTDEELGDARNVPTSGNARNTTSATDGHHSGVNTAAYTAAGAAGAGAAAHHHAHAHDGQSHSTSTSATRDHTSNTSSTTGLRQTTSGDSSHGGQYNVLPSGTPSGINLEGDAHHDTHHDARHQPHQQLHHNTGTIAGAGVGAAAAATGATTTLPHREKSRLPVAETTARGADSRKELGGAGTGTVGVGSGAAILPVGARAGDKVLHKCRKCGEDNDITGYFQK